MSTKNGIEWFPMETDAFTDDEKIDALLYDDDIEQGYADFGRYMKVACRIYREGPALELGRQGERKLMRDLDLDAKGFADFLGRLMDVGLLDRELWESAHVLTSRGIQRRWMTAKKRKELPVGMRQWSLMDAKAPESSNSANFANLGESAQVSEFSENGISGRSDDAREIPVSENPKNPLPRRRDRREEEREVEGELEREEEEREDHPSSLDDASAGNRCPGCLTQPHPKHGRAYLDQDDQPHRTAYGALEARYRAKTGLASFPQLMAKAAQTCPGGCRASPEDACSCYRLMAKAIEAFDPAKGSSPWPLMRKILTEDRGKDG